MTLVTNLMVDAEEAHRLPVRRFAQDIARAVREHDVVVVLAETGSGKTTQIPQVRPSPLASLHPGMMWNLNVAIFSHSGRPGPSKLQPRHCLRRSFWKRASLRMGASL